MRGRIGEKGIDLKLSYRATRKLIKIFAELDVIFSIGVGIPCVMQSINRIHHIALAEMQFHASGLTISASVSTYCRKGICTMCLGFGVFEISIPDEIN